VATLRARCRVALWVNLTASGAEFQRSGSIAAVVLLLQVRLDLWFMNGRVQVEWQR
jgi:hypothetical protein